MIAWFGVCFTIPCRHQVTFLLGLGKWPKWHWNISSDCMCCIVWHDTELLLLQAFELRLWPDQHPLRQFEGILAQELLFKMEDRGLWMERLQVILTMILSIWGAQAGHSICLWVLCELQCRNCSEYMPLPTCQTNKHTLLVFFYKTSCLFCHTWLSVNVWLLWHRMMQSTLCTHSHINTRTLRVGCCVHTMHQRCMQEPTHTCILWMSAMNALLVCHKTLHAPYLWTLTDDIHSIHLCYPNMQSTLYAECIWQRLQHSGTESCVVHVLKCG